MTTPHNPKRKRPPMTRMTRQRLRAMIDPTLIGEIARKPIRPMRMGNVVLRPEAAWVMLIIQTVLPFCRHQTQMLQRYAYLLTPEEEKVAVEYIRIVTAYSMKWREMPLGFPRNPEGFDNILLD